MKALTLHQPWATLIAAGIKTIATCGWSTKYRGPLAIHAAKTIDLPDDAQGFHLGVGSGYWHRRDLPLGAVAATCTLADVLPTVDFMQELSDVRSRIEQIDGVEGPRPSTLWIRRPGVTPATDITDQLHLGDFTPGRFAWLLTDIEPLPEPIPAKGKRGLWTWEVTP